MKNLSIALLCFSLFIASCKKEEDTSQQGTIEFDMDGVHYSLAAAGSLDADTSIVNGLISKTLSISCAINFSRQFNFMLGEFNNPSSDCMTAARYPTSRLLQNCIATPAICFSSQIIYSDLDSAVYNSGYEFDSTAYHITVTSSTCTGSTAKIDGTFEAELKDLTGGTFPNKLVTNGRINGVTYTRQ